MLYRMNQPVKLNMWEVLKAVMREQHGTQGLSWLDWMKVFNDGYKLFNKNKYALVLEDYQNGHIRVVDVSTRHRCHKEYWLQNSWLIDRKYVLPVKVRLTVNRLAGFPKRHRTWGEKVYTLLSS